MSCHVLRYNLLVNRYNSVCGRNSDNSLAPEIFETQFTHRCLLQNVAVNEGTLKIQTIPQFHSKIEYL